MKTTESSGTRPVHQSVAAPIEFHCGGQSIPIEFTDQHLIRKETAWVATEVEGTELAEVDDREADWPAAKCSSTVRATCIKRC